MKKTLALFALALLHLAACGATSSGMPDAAGGHQGAGAGGSAGGAGAAGSSGGAGTGVGGGAAGGAGGLGGTAGSGAAGAAAAGGSPGGRGGVGGAGGRGGAGTAGTGGSAGSAGGSAGGAGGSAGGAGGSAGGPGASTDGGPSDGSPDGAGGVAFMPCPGGGTACAVMPLGDSITEGYPAAMGGYRVELFHQAVTNGRSLTFVGTLTNGPASVDGRPFPQRHEGHRGYTIDTGGSNTGISGQLVDQAIAGQKPQIVLLMIGTNDVNRNVDLANAPTRLGKLLDEITGDAPAALVVVSTIIPINDSAGNTRVLAYNAALPALVSARAAAGKHVVLLDAYAAFVKDPNYKTALMADSLHPNDAGYAVLGRAFFDALRAVLPPGS